MNSRLTLGIISCTLLALLTPTTLIAQTLPYGTARKPHTCPSSQNPKKGAPSVAQAKMYFTCDHEYQHGTTGKAEPRSSVTLINDLTLQVAPRSRPFNKTDFMFANTIREGEYVGMDPEKPVYEIRGSFTRYLCYDTTIKGGYGEVGKNCVVNRYTDGTGICFRNTFGDWHCDMTGAKTEEIGKGIPPTETWSSPQ